MYKVSRTHAQSARFTLCTWVQLSSIQIRCSTACHSINKRKMANENNWDKFYIISLNRFSWSNLSTIQIRCKTSMMQIIQVHIKCNKKNSLYKLQKWSDSLKTMFCVLQFYECERRCFIDFNQPALVHLLFFGFHSVRSQRNNIYELP